MSSKDVGVKNRKRFEQMSESELKNLILSLDNRRRYLCYLLETKFK